MTYSSASYNYTYSWVCGTTRMLTANGIPDHDSTGGNFANPLSPQTVSATFTLTPTLASTTTTLYRTAVAYITNGVKLDPETAGTCPSTATTLNGTGCNQAMGTDTWLLEAKGGSFVFGTDNSNGHTQPNGAYHYHAMPEGHLTKIGKGTDKTNPTTADIALVGFALDGFPLYARYGYTTATDATSTVKVITGSYQLRTVTEIEAAVGSTRPTTSVFALGTFTQDYKYVAGSGDLDECNGRYGVTPEFPNGIYHYYITDTFPYGQRCLKGTYTATGMGGG
jgi:hypothetical protein